MPGTETFILNQTPQALTGLPDAGNRIWLANSGDDALFWSIDDSAPGDREPGFQLAPSSTAEIAAPEAPNKIHAWSPGGTRLLVLGAAGTSPIPAATLRLSVDSVPRVMPQFENYIVGTRGLIYVTGANPVSWISAASQPEPDSSMPPMRTHDVSWFEVISLSPGADTIWLWADRFGGSSVLVQGHVDDGWNI